jgi:dinuclear metal center YbgI/SA1388 family protein
VTATVAEVLACLDTRYPLGLAAEWDANGLICGEPAASVRSILVAVDPVQAIVDEALLLGVDLVITHHPLFLRGVHSVAGTSPGGRVVHTLIAHGIALANAHTNADHAVPGVSDALAAAVGLVDLVPLAPLDAGGGTGRVGRLPQPRTLADFAETVASALPATAHGVRVSGDPAQVLATVAVCGGSGDAHLDDAARVADAYVTADLRHHRALDHRASGGCALLDVAHWASEWPWLPVLARHLAEDLAASGTTVEVHVSTIPTDPWTAHVGSAR